MTNQWTRERWPHERGFGSDGGWVAHYNGHELAVKENGGPFTMYMDGEPLTRDDMHEGIKQLHNAEDAKAYAVKWADGKIKKSGKGALLAPEWGFGTYFTSQMVAVSVMVDGKFEVQIEDPFESRREIVSKIFKEGQDPTDWITKQIAKRMKTWLPEFFKHRGRERH